MRKPPPAYVVQRVLEAWHNRQQWLAEAESPEPDGVPQNEPPDRETADVYDLLHQAMQGAAEAQRFEEFVDAQIAALQIRKARFARQKEIGKLTTHAIMQALEIRREVLPDCDASIRSGPRSVVIIDKDKLEPRFRRVIPETWEPDKVSLRNAMAKDGEVVEGAMLSNGTPYVVIGTK
jgi:hypothetical protein